MVGRYDLLYLWLLIHSSSLMSDLASQEVEEDMKIQVRETFDIFVRLVTTPKYSGPFHEYKKVSH